MQNGPLITFVLSYHHFRFQNFFFFNQLASASVYMGAYLLFSNFCCSLIFVDMIVNGEKWLTFEHLELFLRANVCMCSFCLEWCLVCHVHATSVSKQDYRIPSVF